MPSEGDHVTGGRRALRGREWVEDRTDAFSSPGPGRSFGLTQVRFFALPGIPTLILGPGLLEGSHGPDESVPLENLKQACAISALPAIAMLGRV